MINILKFELKMYIKSVMIWIVSVVSILFMMMAFFPTFGKNIELVEKMMANYPEAMLKAFGMSTGLGLSTVLGYLVFTFVFAQLCLAIQAANYGFSILSVEERELTADFLMSKPVSRLDILNAKFLAAFIALLITNVATWVGTFASLELFKGSQTYNVNSVILLLCATFLFQLFFLTFSMAISVMVKNVKSVLTYSLSLAFGTYIINAIRAIINGELLGYLSPFYHFEIGYILEFGKLNLPLLFLNVTISIMSVFATYYIYVRRDIHSL